MRTAGILLALLICVPASSNVFYRYTTTERLLKWCESQDSGACYAYVGAFHDTTQGHTYSTDSKTPIGQVHFQGQTWCKMSLDIEWSDLVAFLKHSVESRKSGPGGGPATWALAQYFAFRFPCAES